MTLQENLSVFEFNSPQTLDFLKRVHPTGPWTLTYIVENKDPNAKTNSIIRARTFREGDENAMMHWVGENNGQVNLYWQINPLAIVPTNKASLHHVRAVTRFHVDLDPRKGLNNREGEREVIRNLLGDEDWLRRIGLPGGPTFAIDSGNGYWAFWELARPIPIDSDEEGPRREAAAEIGRHNRWIAELLNEALDTVVNAGVKAEIADTCHNIDRISRLPGTLNIPEGKKVTAGYKVEPSSLHFFYPDRLYTADQFQKSNVISHGAGATAEDLRKVEINGIVRILPESSDAYEIAMELQRQFPQIGDKTVQLLCMGEYVDGDEADNNLKDKLSRDGQLAVNRSRAHWRANRHMQHVGVPLNVILGVLCDERLPISAHAIEPIDEKTGKRGARRSGRDLIRFNEIQIRKCAVSLARQQAAEAKARETLAPERAAPEAGSEVPSSEAKAEKPATPPASAAPPAARPPANAGEMVRHLNERHAVLLQEGGKTKVMSWERSEIDYGRETVVLQSFEDFRNRYMNRMVNVGTAQEPKWKPWGKVWLESQGRREYLALRFLPGQPEVVDGYFNMWRGFAVEPQSGDWSLMKAHITDVLADHDPVSADYIIRWAAWTVQNPDAPAEVALVFKGGKGAGKGIFARAIKRIFGQHGLQITSPMQLTGRFNAHLRDCCVLFADEALLPEDKKAENILKSLITEPEIPIEGKGVNVVQARNHLHIIMASNDDWVVPASIDERRFAVFEANRSHIGDHNYFEAIAHQLDNGGMAAMLHELLNMDLEGWHPRLAIPETPALRAQKQRTLDEEYRALLAVLEDGVLPGDNAGRNNTVFSHSHSNTSIGMMDHIRLMNPKLRNISDHRIGSALKALGVTRIILKNKRAWLFPSLKEMRANWDATRFPHDWPDDVVEWGGSDDDYGQDEVPF